MPSDLTLKTMNGIHRALLKVSGGKFGWEASKMPVLELTTTGRKSGQPRSVMLTSPLQEGDTIVVVASAAATTRIPAWFLNLRDNPDVEVAYKGAPKKPMRARRRRPRRARMWPLVTADHKNYAGYQTKTTREIPLVLLEPTGSGLRPEERPVVGAERSRPRRRPNACGPCASKFRGSAADHSSGHAILAATAHGGIATSDLGHLMPRAAVEPSRERGRTRVRQPVAGDGLSEASWRSRVVAHAPASSSPRASSTHARARAAIACSSRASVAVAIACAASTLPRPSPLPVCTCTRLSAQSAIIRSE